MDRTEYIEKSAEYFKELLSQQLDRQERMEKASPAKVFSKMDKIVIGVAGGDGIGPIIMAQTRRVLEKLLAEELSSGRVELRNIEGLTIENRLAQGCAVPPEVLEQYQKLPTTLASAQCMMVFSEFVQEHFPKELISAYCSQV